MPKKKKHKVNKRNLLNRIILPPKKSTQTFWKKEMTLLNRLIKDFGNEKFWDKFSLGKKVESVAILSCDFYQDLIKRKIIEFNYQIPKQKEDLKLEDKPVVDVIEVRKPQTVRNFLE